jgi:hypothetical protein
VVDAHGRPTLLDFGISWGPALGPRVTQSGAFVGTPQFLAPEQILGQPADPRTDLYAVGVLIHEALTGRLPHDQTSVDAVIQAKLYQAPVPLRRVAPDVPSAVAATVDALLAIDPSMRPGTAGDVARSLFAGDASRTWGSPLRYVGSGAAVRALVEAAAAGRSLDVAGPRGSGRSRALEEASRLAEASGRTVVWLAPGMQPFRSVERVVGEAAVASAESLGDARAAVEARRREFLARGSVIVADDLPTIDRWSLAAVDACRGAGTVWRAVDVPDGPHVKLDRLSTGDLRGLFAGPDRLFHLREDGADVLWERTGGLPARVAAEIASWRRAGLAHDDHSLVSISREAIHRLRGGLPVGDVVWAPPLEPHSRSPEADELLSWITLSWPHASVPLLLRVSGLPRWRVEAELGALEADGSVLRLPDGRFQALGAPAGLVLWSAERRAAAHRALADALPPLSLDRFRHLVASDDGAAVVADAVPLARHLVLQGQTADALVVLTEALVSARSGDDTAAETQIVREFAKASLAEGRSEAMDRALFEVSRSAARIPAVAPLETLLRTARDVAGAPPLEAIRALDACAAFDDEDLELWRQAQRARAAWRLEGDEAWAVRESIERWANESGNPRAVASCAGWRANYLHAEQKLEEAARLFLVAVEKSERIPARLNGQVNAAMAWMDCGRLDEALAAAEGARALAAERRHLVYEARAEVLRRLILQRRGDPVPPDPELLAALERLPPDGMLPLAWLCEAIAERAAGNPARACGLAAEASRRAAASGMHEAAVLARCLEISLGASCPPADWASLTGELRGISNATVRVQAFALLASAARRLGFEVPADDFRAALGALRDEERRMRLDVMSVDEACALVAGVTGG